MPGKGNRSSKGPSTIQTAFLLSESDEEEENDTTYWVRRRGKLRRSDQEQGAIRVKSSLSTSGTWATTLDSVTLPAIEVRYSFVSRHRKHGGWHSERSDNAHSWKQNVLCIPGVPLELVNEIVDFVERVEGDQQ